MEDVQPAPALMLNKQQSHAYYPYIIWLLGAFFYFYEFFIQVSPNVIVPELMSTFSLNAFDVSTLTIYYFLAYGAMQLPAGMLLDHFGPRRLITVAVLFCSIGTISFASTHYFALAQFARFVTGIGSAFALLGTLVLTANWFPISRFAFMSGSLITVGMLGAMCGEAPLAFLVEKLNWREALQLLGVFGVFISLLIWLVVRDKPTSPTQPAHITTRATLFRQLRIILTSKKSWLAAIYAGLMYGPTVTLGALWGVMFLTIRYESLTRTSAASLISLLFVGWATGCPLFGAASDYMRKRKPPLYIAAFGALVSIIAFLYIPHLPIYMAGIFLFSFGLFSSGFVPAFSICRELHPAQYSGTALGFVNMLNTLGAALLPALVALCLDYFKNHHAVTANAQYTLANFKIAMALLPISIATAFFLLFFVKETHCQTFMEEE